MRPQIEAVAANGSLLHETDPLPPLAKEVSTALRDRLNAARSRLAETRKQEIAQLEAAPEWTKLPDSMWTDILARVELAEVPEIEAAPMSNCWRSWRRRCSRRGRSGSSPCQNGRTGPGVWRGILEPQVEMMTPPDATLRNEAEVDAYLQVLRMQLMAHVDAGRPVAL